MKNKPLLSAAALLPLAIGLATLPRTAVQPTTGIEAVTCDPEPIDFAQCHDNYPTGCTDSDNPGYDAYLNSLKNLTGSFPGNAQVVHESDFTNLNQNTAPDLTKGNHADFADDLKGLGEGQSRTVIGYLWYWQPTGAETCNCKLTGDNNVDYHIGIGFSKKTFNPPNRRPTKSEQQQSMVVEMTPHTRADKSNWSSDNLDAARGKPVKVVGQLMVDNEHNNVKDNCGYPGHKPTCWRMSAWELHPVTQFLVCKTDSCDESSPDSAWQELAGGEAGGNTPTGDR